MIWTISLPRKTKTLFLPRHDWCVHFYCLWRKSTEKFLVVLDHGNLRHCDEVPTSNSSEKSVDEENCTYLEPHKLHTQRASLTLKRTNLCTSKTQWTIEKTTHSHTSALIGGVTAPTPSSKMLVELGDFLRVWTRIKQIDKATWTCFRSLKNGLDRSHWRVQNRVHVGKASCCPRTASRAIHTSPQTNWNGLTELFESLSQHPAIMAVTGGGGLGLLAALYRHPHFWNFVLRATTDNNVLILPQKPSHVFQPREREMKELQAMLKDLRRRNPGNIAQVVYITGRPGLGKTQIARQFAQQYHARNKGVLFRRLFVGTLNASTPTSILQSYINMTVELGCTTELKALDSLTGITGNLLLVCTLNRCNRATPLSACSFVCHCLWRSW